MLARLRTETYTPDLCAVVLPAAMRPWAHDERIEGARVVLLDGLVRGERTLRILGIEPAANREYRGFHIFQVWRNIA